MRRRWWLLLVCVPVGLVAGLLASAVLIYIQPKLFESTAVVEIKPSAVVSLPDAGGGVPVADPAFFEKEMAHLTSPEVMRRAVVKGAFDKRWGMTKEVAVEEMGRSVRVERIQGTDLLSIRALSVFRQDAPEMAEAVADGYREDRVARVNKDSAQALERLKQMVRGQEDIVEESRKRYAPLVKLGPGRTRTSSEEEEYHEKKKDFEAKRDSLESLKLKYVTEKARVPMSEGTLAVHEKPQLPMKPAGPDATKYLRQGLLAGLGAGLAIGLLMVLLFPKRIPSN